MRASRYFRGANIDHIDSHAKGGDGLFPDFSLGALALDVVVTAGRREAPTNVRARLKSHDFSPIEMSLGAQAPSGLTAATRCRVFMRKRTTRRPGGHPGRITGRGHRRPRLYRQAILSLSSLGLKYPGGLGAEPQLTPAKLKSCCAKAGLWWACRAPRDYCGRCRAGW